MRTPAHRGFNSEPPRTLIIASAVVVLLCATTTAAILGWGPGVIGATLARFAG